MLGVRLPPSAHIILCPGGETGKHNGLKNRSCESGPEGSIPSLGTMKTLDTICTEIISETIVEEQCLITEMGIFHKETGRWWHKFETPVPTDKLKDITFRIKIDF